MEHRHHQRVAVDIRAFIYQCGLPVATGRIRNASRRGFFIETDYGELQAHQCVLCELHPGGGAGSGPQRVRVCVVRCSPEGAAVELDEDDGPLATAVIACARQSGAVAGAC